MTTGLIITLLTQAVALVLLISAPMLLTGLLVGFVVALLQTVTSIQEQTLSFVPKAVAVLLVLIFVAPWIINLSVNFVQHLLAQIPILAN
ncbi:MAG: flagellar biosynthesis protein FliQ [Candidatus Sericytochromatia bacterium]|nr:flagellar biosynthesis protein FliQ [Candidatus Sericytochromatia bacterium]